MSDPGRAGIGNAHPGRYGGAAGGVTLGEVVLARCWNVQGDGAHRGFSNEIRTRFGVALPKANSALAATAWTALWLGPKSWLLVARDAAPAAPGEDFVAARDALNACGGALFDVSAGRAAFVVAGEHAATTLAKHCPIDLHESVFPPGACAQSLFGHVNCPRVSTWRGRHLHRHARPQPCAGRLACVVRVGSPAGIRSPGRDAVRVIRGPQRRLNGRRPVAPAGDDGNLCLLLLPSFVGE